jgi:hypothetical protein
VCCLQGDCAVMSDSPPDLDNQEILAELASLNLDISFDAPTTARVSTINLDFKAEMDFFWKSHFNPSFTSTSTSTTELPDEDDEEFDPTYVPGDAEDEDTDDLPDQLAAAPASSASSSQLQLPNCRCKCKQRIPTQAAQDILQQFAPISREFRRLLVHAMTICSFDAKPTRYTRKSTQIAVARYSSDADSFNLLGVTVCRKFFRSLLGERNCGKSLLDRVLSDLRAGKFVPSKSQYVGSSKGQHLRSSTVREWLSFLASTQGLPVPHARWSTDEHTAVQLPATYNKTQVFKQYQADIGELSVTDSQFFRIWRDEFNWLRVCNKYTDYCNSCYNAKASGDRAALIEHISFVKLQHAYIKAFLFEAMSALGSLTSENRAMWLSLDFAQSVRLPLFVAYQPGHSFFQTGLNVDMFGIIDDIHAFSHIFLLVEGHTASAKDVNSILSMLYWQLQQPHPDSGAATLILHGDNCAGQLKNRYFVWFCAWLLGQSTFAHLGHIHVLYNLPGHTKFSPDRAFAAVKRTMQRKTVFTPSQMISAIQQLPAFSAHCMSAVTMYDWREFLSTQYRKSVPSISLTSHWHFERSKPNFVTTKAYATDSLSVVDLSLASDSTVHSLTQFVLPLKTLPDSRRQELIQNMSPHSGIMNISEYFHCACD